jgi:hypothetical protein
MVEPAKSVPDWSADTRSSVHIGVMLAPLRWI